MSADVLRQAAALMREQAEAVAEPAPSPWEAHPATHGDPADGPTSMRVSDAKREEIASLPYEKFGGVASEHIASWHPAVALAVADWLEGEADELAEALGALAFLGPPVNEPHGRFGRALAVANAYLQETP